jgi:hypothetical protein
VEVDVVAVVEVAAAEVDPHSLVPRAIIYARN